MEKKYVLVTGATGGIGGAIIKLLAILGYYVLAPGRNKSRAVEIFGNDPHIIIDECNLESEEAVTVYLRKKKEERIIPVAIILAAGTFKWDDYEKFPGNTIEEKFPHAKEFLVTANFKTKESFLVAVHQAYSKDECKEIILAVIGSQAAKFAKDDFRRERQEAYHISHAMVASLEGSPSVQGFKKFFLFEPPWVSTDLVKDEFRIGKGTMTENPNWEEQKSPDEFAKELATETGLI